MTNVEIAFELWWKKEYGDYMLGLTTAKVIQALKEIAKDAWLEGSLYQYCLDKRKSTEH